MICTKCLDSSQFIAIITSMKALASLFNKGEKIKFKKNDIIENPREKGKVYLVKEGFIKVYEQIGTDIRILIILEPGHIFPITKSSSNVTSKVYLEALTNVDLLALDHNTFFDKADTNVEILKNIIELLSHYLYIYVERIENLGRTGIQDKLIARLIHFEKRFGEGNGIEKKVKIPVTHEFLAESINVARENVSREISKLQKEKIIILKNGTLTILNSRKLHSKIEKALKY